MPHLESTPGGDPPRTGEPRLRDLLEIERGFWGRGVRMLAGIDEVGRGPLAGPVVAAAVVMPPECQVCGADDSKVLAAERRAELAAEIAGRAVAVGIGAASCREIDRINIRRATALAMERALRRLRGKGFWPEHVLVDGLPVPELGLEWQTAVVGGDGLVHSIACASIVAKVCRDDLMRRLASRYPEYGWERNKGYSTPEHREALDRHGATPHHRRSFQPIEQLMLTLAT
jgi:ribonuclease HII